MKNNKIYKNIKELVPYIIVLIIIILVKKYVFTTIIVNGDSMNNTLKENDIMILDKISYRMNDIKRFDIVTIKVPKNNNTKLIKRIIGLPGEHIKYEDNELYVNGKKIKDDYGTGVTYDYDVEELYIKKIPENYYFVLGDNREDSIDSRVIGLVHKNNVLGHAVFRIYPFNKFGKVE